ncbi:hypothetical protein BG95_00140 [Thermosipho sp. 1063]|nr:hypothetical protein Y592_00140 [Thermosipho sp. 1070]APT72978.1 hypothetical protein BG95_00140 [Thermosipho sp. 1063]OOC46065.1 hypothetical protein XO08_00145 [Thermosipho sp. 1074]
MLSKELVKKEKTNHGFWVFSWFIFLFRILQNKFVKSFVEFITSSNSCFLLCFVFCFPFFILSLFAFLMNSLSI